jgi:hypothetical protein
VSASTSYAVFPGTEASPASRARSAALGGTALTLLSGLAAALPVIVTTIRAIAQGWVPLADQGTIATRAYEVFTAHTPLVGQYSFASRAVGHATSDPGPMLYWLLALPARFGGAPALTAVMGAVNTAAIVGSVALARRRGGRPLMFGAAAAIALMSHSFGSEALHGIWNPAAALYALTLLCFLCWSIACGEHLLLPLAAAAASFVIQCHLAYVVPALALLVVALVGLALSLRAPARRPQARELRRPWRSPLMRSLAATLVVTLACWSAPLADQVEHTPGNLALLATAATTSHTTEGARVGWRALTSAIGLPPRWLRAPQRAVASGAARAEGPVSGGDYGDTRLADILRAPSTRAVISSVLLLAGLLVALAASLRVRRGDVAAAATIGLVLCASFAWVESATPVRDFATLGYTLWWGSLVGMWVWLVLIWSAATLAGTRLLARARHRRERRANRASSVRAALPARLLAPAGLIVVIACAGVLAAKEPEDAHEPEFRASRAIERSVASAVPRGSTVVLAQRGLVVLPFAPAVIYALRRRDARVVRYEPGQRSGSAPAAGARRLRLVLWEDAPRSDGRSAIARVRVRLARAPWLPGAQSPHTIAATLAS